MNILATQIQFNGEVIAISVPVAIAVIEGFFSLVRDLKWRCHIKF